MFSFSKKKTPPPEVAPVAAPVVAPASTLVSTPVVTPAPTYAHTGSLIGTRVAPAIELPVPGTAPERKDWVSKLSLGLRKTGSSISTVFTGTQITESLYDEL